MKIKMKLLYTLCLNRGKVKEYVLLTTMMVAILMLVGSCFVDDYFGLHILENDNVQNEASQNLLQICGVNPIDHPSHICGASKDNNKVICSNPTPTNLSDRTPGDGCHVKEMIACLSKLIMCL